MKKDYAEQNLENNERDSVVGFSRKTGYDFLSNFFASTVAYEGTLYPTVEHAYQASKTLDKSTREIIRKAPDPNKAKRLGQSIVVRSDWHDVRVNIMKSLIKEKFENPFLKWRLLETKNKELINENRWNDKFWGVVNGKGENWLGKILQDVRQEILNEETQTLIEVRS